MGNEDVERQEEREGNNYLPFLRTTTHAPGFELDLER